MIFDLLKYLSKIKNNKRKVKGKSLYKVLMIEGKCKCLITKRMTKGSINVYLKKHTSAVCNSKREIKTLMTTEESNKSGCGAAKKSKNLAKVSGLNKALVIFSSSHINISEATTGYLKRI